MTEPPADTLVIAIDGPAAAGKGTLARRLAAHFGLPYLDTGLLYRAVGRRVLDAGGDPADPGAAEAAARSLQRHDLARGDLRGPGADEASSQVAAFPAVRVALLAFQRAFGTEAGAVLDGRDIGTVIFPGAAIKFFVTASEDERGVRRWRELRARGMIADLDAVTSGVRARDQQDSARETAPLRPAHDAMLLDTTGLDADKVFARALELIGERVPRPASRGKRAVPHQ